MFKRSKTVCLVVTLLLGILPLVTTGTNVYAQGNAEGPTIEATTIDGLFSDEYTRTNQVLPLTTVTLLNFLLPNQPKTVNDLLKTVYAAESDNQLQNKTASMQQCVKYIESLGFKPKWESKALDVERVKEELKNKRPVIAYLKSNGNYWIEPYSAVIIYSVTTFKFPGDPITHATYAARSVNHAGGSYIDSEKTSEIPLLQRESYIDPTLSSNYSWVGTVYNITK